MYLDCLDDGRRTSLDYYATMRSLYRQRRDALVNAGKKDIEAIRNPGHYDYNSPQ